MVEIAATAGVVVRLADVVPVREIPDHHHIVNIMLRIQSLRIIKKYYFEKKLVNLQRALSGNKPEGLALYHLPCVNYGRLQPFEDLKLVTYNGLPQLIKTLPKALRTQASTALPSNLVWIGGFGLVGLAQ